MAIEIGFVPSLASAEGCYGLGRAARIRGDQANHIVLRGDQGIVGQAADMALVIDRGGGDVRGLGLLDQGAHGALGHREAEAPIAVHHHMRRRFALHFIRCAGHDMAALDPVDIGGDGDDAVAVMAGQIGADTAPGDNGGLLGRASGAFQQFFCDGLQAVVGNGRHRRRHPSRQGYS